MQITTTNAAGETVRQEFPWSFSHIRNFETCPHRYEQIDLLKKFKEDDSPHLKEGFYVHDKMARAINYGEPLPPTVPYQHWIDYALKGSGKVVAEQKLAITRGFTKCEYFDKIKKVWLRTVADVLRVDGRWCHIIDWKTGKVKPEPEQLLLIATCALAHHSGIHDITAELVWLGDNTKTTIECTVDDIVKFWGDTMFDKVKALQEARNTGYFPKKRSGLCRKHCPVTSCEHCGQ